MVSSTPRPHFTPGKEPVPILQEAGWTPGPVWTGGKSRPHRDSIPDRPARSQSLYRLSYPAHPPIAVRYLNVRIGITETLPYKDISCTSYLLFPRRCFQIGFSLGICFLQLCQSTRPSAMLKIRRHHQPGSTRWRSWLRHCATTLKVAGSIHDVVTGIFH